jgi:hypothetical protein
VKYHTDNVAVDRALRVRVFKHAALDNALVAAEHIDVLVCLGHSARCLVWRVLKHLVFVYLAHEMPPRNVLRVRGHWQGGRHSVHGAVVSLKYVRVCGGKRLGVQALACRLVLGVERLCVVRRLVMVLADELVQ